MITPLISNEIPKEVLLIIELLKEKNENFEIINDLIKEIDWNNFLEYAIHHRVFPLLYLKIKLLNHNSVPGYVLGFLGEIYKQNTFTMLQLTGEMEYISRIFEEQEIHTLFLKGPVIAKELYGDISSRTSRDLDLLIPIQHLEGAEELLLKEGYVKEYTFQSVLGDWKWRHRHVNYYHPIKKILIEIHWRLHPGPSKEPSFQELWERSRKSSLTQYPIHYLGKEDLFLFLVSHGARHGWSRLRWLDDIQQLIKQPIDWEITYKLFKSYHNPAVGGQALILTAQLFDTKLLKEMDPFLEDNKAKILAEEAIFYLEKMVNLHSDPVPEDVNKYHKRHLLSLMSTKQKILFILSFMYPYPEDAKVIPLPKNLHFLYFPLRPLIWTWRKLRKPVVQVENFK